MTQHDFIGHLRLREYQPDIPYSQYNTTESTLSSSSTRTTIPFNKIYQDKLNTKTFLSSIWHLRFNKNIPHQQFETTETEHRTHLQMKFSLQLQHYNAYIKTINKSKFTKKLNYIDQMYFTLSFIQQLSTTSNSVHPKKEFHLKQNDQFNINITIYNEHVKIDKITFTADLDYVSSIRKALVNVVSYLNTNNNDNVNLILHINIEIEPKHNIKQTYIGLINKGNTCYLNSIIQMFYMLPLFAKEIKQTTSSSSTTSTLLHALKRLFIAMDNNHDNNTLKCVSPEEFIHCLEQQSGKSMRRQHDIQEFFMIMGDVLGKETSNSTNIYALLFEGKLSTSITCKHVTYSSTKEESFNDIQLVVKECKSINDSFDNFTSNEELHSNNQYQTDIYGKQDAIKRTVFSHLPKVLLIQLKRFEYNVEHNQMDKVYSSFTFEQQLNMLNYIDSSIYKGNTNYTCRGVIVHSGSSENGHYYTFIKDKNEEWFKFNDSIVECAYEYEVYDNNYGGEVCYYAYSLMKGGIVRTVKGQNTSAYVLMYVREDCLNEIYCNCNMYSNNSDSSGCDNIVVKIEKQIAMDNMVSDDNELKVFLISDEILKWYQRGLGVLLQCDMDVDGVVRKLPLISKYNVNTNETVDAIGDAISSKTNVNKSNIHLYTVTFSYNNNDRRIIYNAKYIYDITTMQITSIEMNSISSLKRCIFIYAYEQHEMQLTRYEHNKWTFNMNNSSNSSSNSSLNEQLSTSHTQYKRFILKLPIIKYDYITRNINLNYHISHIQTLTPSQYETLLNPLSSNDIFNIKHTFINHYLNKWDIIIDNTTLNSFTYLIETQDTLAEYKTLPLTKENINTSNNDIICCILNVNLNVQWNDKSFIAFNSIKEVIEREYTLIDTLTVKVINESDVNVEEVEVNVNHFNFSPKAVVRQILTVCNCDSITNAHRYRLIATKKNTNYRIILAVYNYYNHSTNIVDTFKRIIRNNYNAYELIYKYIP